MTERTTESQLNAALERLNGISKCRYELDHAYGAIRINLKYPNSGGVISDVTIRGTKSEIYYIIQGILTWHEKEKRKDNHVKACVHLDGFNSRNDTKMDRSVTWSRFNERTKKTFYSCHGCGKTLTEKEFQDSKKPRTFSDVQKLIEQKTCKKKTNGS